MPKTYQFINVVYGVGRSHKTANIFFYLTQYHSLLTGMYNVYIGLRDAITRQFT